MEMKVRGDSKVVDQAGQGPCGSSVSPQEVAGLGLRRDSKEKPFAHNSPLSLCLPPFSNNSIYKKAGIGKEKRQVTYLVAKKGAGRKVRRPAGVKGHFKVVDSRLKKDMRAQKRKEQKPKHRQRKK